MGRIADMGDIARTDAELVEASRRGEREAFGHLVTRYQDLVCAVSYSSTGNWALSEDVAQDTFIAAWRQLGQLREVGRLRSWLCGIARNLARKARRRDDHETTADCDLGLAAPDANPFDATAQAEVDRVVREALARVPDTYRETLVLYYCENRSVREVADALGIAEAAAMQRLTRGRRYLADGVNALVERSLRAPRRSKNLAVLVVAALPALTVSSRVDASPNHEGSTTMLKIGIAAAVVAAVGTGSVLAVRQMQAPATATAKTTTTTTAASAATTRTASEAAARPALARAAGAPTIGQRAGFDDDDEPKVIPKATIKRLGLDRGPSRGTENAPVTIIVFQDLMCKYCADALGTIDQLLDEYPGKLRLVVKQLPVHDAAVLAAEASLAADAQGKFWELHDVMIAHQDDLSRDAIVAYAKQAGLDVGKLADALDRHTFANALAKEVAAAKEIGVSATPELLINGQDIQGLRPIETFRAAIDAALAAR